MKPRHKKLVLNVGKATFQGRRSTQDDCFFDLPAVADSPWLGIVSNGIGGHQGADAASQIGVQAVRDFFKNEMNQARPVAESLRAGIDHAHAAVVRSAETLGCAGRIGATVLAFAINDDALTWSSAGDARLFLVRDAVLTQLTHGFTTGADPEQAVEARNLSEQEGGARKFAVAGFLGAGNLRTDDGSIEIRPGDFIVACTDGIYRNVGNAGLIAACKAGYAAKSAPAEKAADALFNDFVFRLQDLSQDSATLIIVNVRELDAHGAAIQPRYGRKRAVALGAAAAGSIGLIAGAVAMKQPIGAFFGVHAPASKMAQGRLQVAAGGTEWQAGRNTELTGGTLPQPADPPLPSELSSAQAADRARLDLAMEQFERAKQMKPPMQAGYMQAAIDVFEKLSRSGDASIAEEAMQALQDAERTMVAVARPPSRIDARSKPLLPPAPDRKLHASRGGADSGLDGPWAPSPMVQTQAGKAGKIPESSEEPNAVAADQDRSATGNIPDTAAAAKSGGAPGATATGKGQDQTADSQGNKPGRRAPVEERSVDAAAREPSGTKAVTRAPVEERSLESAIRPDASTGSDGPKK